MGMREPTALFIALCCNYRFKLCIYVIDSVFGRWCRCLNCRHVRSEFLFIPEVSWPRSYPIATAWTVKAFPLHEYVAYLTSLLPSSIATSSSWFYRFMSYAYSFTRHICFEAKFIKQILHLLVMLNESYLQDKPITLTAHVLSLDRIPLKNLQRRIWYDMIYSLP